MIEEKYPPLSKRGRPIAFRKTGLRLPKTKRAAGLPRSAAPQYERVTRTGGGA